MADPRLAQSAIDRLQPAAHELVLDGESYRQRQKTHHHRPTRIYCSCMPRLRVLIAYSVPPESRKAASWSDGFVAAVGLLSQEADVQWVNVADPVSSKWVNPKNFDYVLAKSNWGWVVDRFVRTRFAGSPTRRGIMISGSARPPSRRLMRFYDILHYETEWYRRFIDDHPRCVHAFGVDTDVMNPSVQCSPKQIDWLTVGSFWPAKRQLALLAKSGRRLAIGDLVGSDASIIERLVGGGIEVRDFVPQTELATIYGTTESVFIPASIQGGGERAVLEARACGTPVEVAQDNPKLQGLLSVEPVWSHIYYSRQLLKGLEMAMSIPRRKSLDLAIERTDERFAGPYRGSFRKLRRKASVVRSRLSARP